MGKKAKTDFRVVDEVHSSNKPCIYLNKPHPCFHTVGLLELCLCLDWIRVLLPELVGDLCKWIGTDQPWPVYDNTV